MNKKPRTRSQDEEKPDRLSSLSDDLIHHVLSFLGTRQAVQTSVLSKRWKHIWCTFPFLTLDWPDQLFPYTHSTILNFMDNFFLKRDHQTCIFSSKLFAVYPFPPSSVKKLINSLNEHNVQELDIDLYVHRYSPFKLSTFNSSSIKTLRLCVPLDVSDSLESDCLWDLPVLTTLYLICPPHMSNYKLPKSSLIYLPLLTTLCLDRVELPESLSSFTLPVLTTLCLDRVEMPESLSSFSLPVLTTLCLHRVEPPESLSSFSLPVLTTLCLDRVGLPESLSSFSLPVLTTLLMRRCKLPETIWDLPALLSVELDDVILPENNSVFLSALVNLRDLTINFGDMIMKNCFISCPQLVNLRITTTLSTRICFANEIVVVVPKLHYLYCVGIFPIVLNVHELVHVNIKLWDTNGFMNVLMSCKYWYYCRVVKMFSKLDRAKILTLDSATIEVLSTLFDFFESISSPFHELKYVKLPQGYNEFSISTTLRKYLLGGNPRASIVTTLPQESVDFSERSRCMVI